MTKLLLIISILLSTQFAHAFSHEQILRSSISLGHTSESEMTAHQSMDRVCERWEMLVREMASDKLEEVTCNAYYMRKTTFGYQYSAMGRVKLKKETSINKVFAVNITGVQIPNKQHNNSSVNRTAHMSYWYNCNKWKKGLIKAAGDNLVLASCGTSIQYNDYQYGTLHHYSSGTVLLAEFDDSKVETKVLLSNFMPTENESAAHKKHAQKEFWRSCVRFMDYQAVRNAGNLYYIDCGQPKLEYYKEGWFYKSTGKAYLKK